MSARNIINKIWDAHVVTHKEGHPAVLAIDLMLIHEVTSSQAFAALREKGLPVADPSRLLATLDHSIPTREDRFLIYDETALRQVEELRSNCRINGIPLMDFDSGKQGIVHVIGPELGLTQVGMTIVCGDSHTATHGAFGALAFGVGTSEVAHVLATACLLQSPPRTMQVAFNGRFSKSVFAKDAILALIAEIGIGGANAHVIEYTGSAVREMSMEERMTVCNMSIECGARAGLISPDETTFNYLKDKPLAPKGEQWLKARAYWETLVSDPGATYDRMLEIDINNLRPMVTWGTNPGQAVAIDQKLPELESLDSASRLMAERALSYVKLEPGKSIRGTPIDWAFLGSCTNGRIEDLRVAAKILAGKRISPKVTMYVIPGSEQVRKQAIEEGLAEIFLSAGAEFRQAGCSMCLGMNDDKVPSGARCISASNRNFVGRQGPGSITHLASPATVAASAISGCINSAEEYL